jgi:hypothetical protein
MLALIFHACRHAASAIIFRHCLMPCRHFRC